MAGTARTLQECENLIDAFQEEVKYLKAELKKAERGRNKGYREGYRDAVMDELKD